MEKDPNCPSCMKDSPNFSETQWGFSCVKCTSESKQDLKETKEVTPCEPCTRNSPDSLSLVATKHNMPFCWACLPYHISDSRQPLEQIMTCSECGTKTKNMMLVSCCDEVIQYSQEEPKSDTVKKE